LLLRQSSVHSNDFENEFENEPLFAPISQNELTPEAVSDSLKEAEKGGGEGGIEISGENMLERGKIEAIIGNNYVESVMKIQLAEFIAPQDVANPAGPSWLVLGGLIFNQSGLPFKVQKTMEGLLEHYSGRHLHLVVVTDKSSRGEVADLIARILTRWVGRGAILRPGWRWRRQRALPHIQFSLVDIEQIIQVDRKLMEGAKRLNTNVPQSKYNKDLFYISPLYGKAFTKLEKMIFIDMDLDFYGDIELLWNQFSELHEPQVVGVGRDLSPHYSTYLANYNRGHPGSKLGQPGPLQGINTGVVLFWLERMRWSLLFNDELNFGAMKNLSTEFGMTFTLGDQDWWAMLSWKKPELFYNLPCRFNKQMSLQYLREPWEEIFDSYHNCSSTKAQTMIFHRNGCGPTPELCMYYPSEDSAYWAQNSPNTHRYEVHADVELFWYIMAEPQTYLRKGTMDMLLSGLIFLPPGVIG